MISINATLIVQVINLLVLIFILNRLMYKPVRAILQKRQDEMIKGRAEIERIARENEADQAAFDKELFEKRKMARERLQEMRLEAEKKGFAVIEEAQKKSRQKDAEITAMVEAEMAKARSDISREAEVVARSMAGTLLGREVS